MTTQQRTVLIAAVAAVLGFAIGAGWQYASARGYASDLDDTRSALALQQLEATLGAATIEAQRGSHEIARQLASSFFTGLQAAGSNSPQTAQATFRELLAQRDVMITALSRGDPQAGSMLAQMFVRYRIAMGEPVGPGAVNQTSPPAVDPQ
ncbi:MAG: hypothetical protein WD054_03150 [Gemmatimonadota bacterium]